MSTYAMSGIPLRIAFLFLFYCAQYPQANAQLYSSGNNPITGNFVGISQDDPKGVLHIYLEDSGMMGPGNTPVPNAPLLRLHLENTLYSRNHIWDFDLGEGPTFNLRYQFENTSPVNLLSVQKGSGIFNTDYLSLQKKVSLHTGTVNSGPVYQIGLGAYPIVAANAWSFNNNSGGAVLHTDGAGTFKIVTYPSSGVLTAQNFDNYVKMTIDGQGRVGIGSLQFPNVQNDQGNPYLLYVKGGILTQEVNIKLTEGAWPDYVFEEDYPLLPLSELKAYLAMHGHLPHSPSSEVMENEGLEIKRTTLTQQQQIEELYLYVIQLKEELDDIKAENQLLKAQLEKQE